MKTPRFCFFFFVKRPAGLARGFCGARLGPSCRPRRTEAGEQEKQENGGWRQFGLNAKKICGGQKKKGPCDILIFRKNENDVGWLKGNRVGGLGRWRGRLFELIVSRNGAPMSCGMGGKGVGAAREAWPLCDRKQVWSVKGTFPARELYTTSASRAGRGVLSVALSSGVFASCGRSPQIGRASCRERV